MPKNGTDFTAAKTWEFALYKLDMSSKVLKKHLASQI